MNWRWRAPNTNRTLQCTSKAFTKGAVKEAAMVEPSLLYTELVLQAMKLIFSPCQKSLVIFVSLISTRGICEDNWLLLILLAVTTVCALFLIVCIFSPPPLSSFHLRVPQRYRHSLKICKPAGGREKKRMEKKNPAILNQQSTQPISLATLVLQLSVGR